MKHICRVTLRYDNAYEPVFGEVSPESHHVLGDGHVVSGPSNIMIIDELAGVCSDVGIVGQLGETEDIWDFIAMGNSC